LLIGRLIELDATTLARLKNTMGESTTLDFKRELPERSHNGSREFLKDLCAFANTHGGDLVFGIVEQNGVAVDVPGIEAADPGAEQERLEQIACSDGIEPRLPRPEFCRIEVGTGRFVFVVRVSQSWTAPHRVSLQGHGHFYARGATTTFAMNVQQLREAFTAAGSRIQRIREFRAERLRQIGGNVPVRLLQTDRATGMAPSLAVLHLVPLQSFAPASLSLDVARLSEKIRKFYPIRFSENDGSSRLNLEGQVNFAGQVGSKPAEYRAYTQVYRSGCVEAVWALSSRRVEEHQFECIYPFEGDLREAVERYKNVLGELGISPPVYCYLALRRVSGKHLELGRSQQSDETFDHDVIDLPEVFMDPLDAPVDDIVRPMLNVLWNAVGHKRCPRYDNSGKWVE
jgi:Putative DNA-binding domain